MARIKGERSLEVEEVAGMILTPKRDRGMLATSEGSEQV